jgi:hypothetical protein
MYTKNEEYQTPGEFAKHYRGKAGKGVQRSYISKLIRQEMTSPGTTGLDVFEIAGYSFVRYSLPTGQALPKQQEADTNELINQIIAKAGK